ncbi:MAG: hypothetical protein LBG92_12800 [Prevotellaceae bacterium]|jgi:hypothetical protein|nr:hypothetical protein [Prevotellaceae bacterium]
MAQSMKARLIKPRQQESHRHRVLRVSQVLPFSQNENDCATANRASLVCGYENLAHSGLKKRFQHLIRIIDTAYHTVIRE